jgi:hypothetical protein
MKPNNHQTLDNAKKLQVEAKKKNETVGTEHPSLERPETFAPAVERDGNTIRQGSELGESPPYEPPIPPP